MGSGRAPGASWWASSPAIGRREVLVVALVGCLLALLMHWPLPLHLTNEVPKDAGDTLTDSWAMAWDGHALLHQPLHFFQANLYYPDHNVRAWKDGQLGFLPLSVIGTGPTAAITRHNILFFFTYALAFVAAYLLARELGLGRWGAAVAAAAFAYAPYVLEHDAELNVLSSGPIPLALFLGLRGYRRRRPGLVVAGWLVAGWQATLTLNLGVTFFYMLVVLALIAAVSWARRRWPLPRRLVVATVVGMVAAIGMNIPLLSASKAVRDEFGPRSPALVDFYSTGPRSYLAAPEANLLWGRATAGVRRHLDWVQEQTLFPGLAIVALALVGVLRGRLPRGLRIGLPLAAVAAAWLALGFDADGSPFLWPYRFLYDYLPGWDGLRNPERIWVVTMLALALLAGAGASALLSRIEPGRRATIAGLALAGVVLVEGSGFHVGRPWWPIRLGADAPTVIGGPPHAPVPKEPPGLRGLPDPQLHLPVQTGEFISPRVALWSTDGFPRTLNGVGSEQPHSYERLKVEMRGFPDRRSLARLRQLRVKVVILHPDLVPGTPWAHTAGKPIHGLGVTRHAGGGVVVYRLVPPPGRS